MTKAGHQRCPVSFSICRRNGEKRLPATGRRMLGSVEIEPATMLNVSIIIVVESQLVHSLTCDCRLQSGLLSTLLDQLLHSIIRDNIVGALLRHNPSAAISYACSMRCKSAGPAQQVHELGVLELACPPLDRRMLASLSSLRDDIGRSLPSLRRPV